VNPLVIDLLLQPLLVALLTLGAALALIPALTLFGQCLVAAVTSGRCRLPYHTPGRVAILVPAHDEEAGIAATVTALLKEKRADDILLVVADNCADRTAEVARAAGATVVERRDPERRGKGHALTFGVQELAGEKPDAVVVVDADCRLSPGSVLTLAAHALATKRPVQADYVLEPADPSPRSAISALAFLVKNRVRPRGQAALGLPCQLTGSGMAFPWYLVNRRRLGGGHIVEDLVIGLEMALRGVPPLACSRARVTSSLADRAPAAATQRRRWEHGHLAAIRSHAPRLFSEALSRWRFDLFALAMDLCVPPLTLLLLAIAASVGVDALAMAYLGAPALPLALSVIAAASVTLGLGLAWLRFGRELVPARRLIAVPLYLAWKLPIAVAFLLGRGERRWVRTERAAA
jgi:cellulose synthase/poly-beta-1,6-N-acetylglucosamine synthase-like glycosyltransferase